MSFFHVILSWTAVSLFCLIVILFLGYCLYIQYIHMKYDHIPGPSRDSFFFGHTPTILKTMSNDEVIHDKFLQWSETHGSVCRINALHYVFFLVTCPEGTKDILMSAKYPKDKFIYKKLFNLFGQSQKPKYLGYGSCRLEILTSFAARVCAVVIGGLKLRYRSRYHWRRLWKVKVTSPLSYISRASSSAFLAHVPSANMEAAGFMIYTATSHQGTIEMFWLFLGNGLVTAQDHEQWYKQRRMMDPAFSSLYLRGLMGTFNERAEKLTAKLADAADNQTDVTMLHLFNFITLDVIAKVAFGVDLNLLKGSPFPKAIEICLKGMIYYARDHFFEWNPKNWTFIKEVREACRLLRTTGAEWINNRKAAMQNGDDVPKDILTQIIKSAGKEKSVTKEDEELMLDNFVTFFIAGQETTANQLAFCVMELGRHPDILEKVKKEVDDVIGMKREISYDDLGELIYLSQVLKESLRLYPPAPGTSRDILEDTVIDGIRIPGGNSCFFSSYTAGRMEKFFKDPLTFDPDRFHPDAPKPYYCYYPFALGPRSCLGQNFAQMEAKVIMAKLIQRFDFTLVPGQTFDLRDNGTLRPKSGVVCSVRHRNHKK